MFKKSKIYLAGHTGLLGNALLKVLNSQGYKNVITRTHNELDLTDPRAVSKFFANERPEYIFLAAGLTGGILASKSFPAEFFITNAMIQNSVFTSVHKYSVKNIVFYGSSCMYPRDCAQPMKEEYFLTGKLEESSQAYAIAKISGVVACKAYNEQYKTKRFIALVPNSMYGPNDNFDLNNSHVLSALIRRFHEARNSGKTKVVLWGSGKPRREFVFSEDVARASIFAIQNAGKLENTHYNVGSGIDYSIKDLAQTIAETVGFRGEIDWDLSKGDGTPRKLLDSYKFNSLGWKPKITLKEGIEIAYKWYKENE